MLAVLSRAIDERVFKKRLFRNKARLGPNFREIANHLEVEEKSKIAPVVRRLRGWKEELSETVVDEGGDDDVEATPRPKAASSSRPVIGDAEDEDEDFEGEGREAEEAEEVEEHDPSEPEDPEKEAESSDSESEADPEVSVPPDGDGDEEMPDVDDE